MYREIRTSVDRSIGDFTVHFWRTRDRERTAYDRGDTNTLISVTILQIVLLTNFIDGGVGTVHLRCPWHLFIKFPITRCSSHLLMMLISSLILRFSSFRVRGFVLYPAFLNLPRCLKFVIQIMDCWTWWNFYTRESCVKVSSYLADWVNNYWS